MNANLVLWYASRIAALTAFVVMAVAMITGIAIRTSLFGAFARNRAILAVHGFTAWFWVPLIAVHMTALVLDSTARVGILDVFVPFVSQLPAGRVAIGLGTLSFLLLVLIGATSGLRKRMSSRLWLALHRLSYPLFVLIAVHAQLAGTDFSRTAMSVTGWAVLGMLGVMAFLRAIGGRVEIVR